jgi:hypothetical protein
MNAEMFSSTWRRLTTPLVRRTATAIVPAQIGQRLFAFKNAVTPVVLALAEMLPRQRDNDIEAGHSRAR